MTLRQIGIGCAAAIAMSSLCYAGYVNEGGVGVFRVVGKVASSDVVGFARNVRLKDAVRQVIPSGYSVQIGAGATNLMDKRVYWNGGRQWTDVLSDMVAPITELSVDIDANSRVVSFSSAVATSAEHSAVPSSESASESASAPARAVWTIVPGKRLSEILEQWGREAGWQSVVWEAPDMVAEMGATFEGTFEEAVKRTMESLSRSGTQLKAVFYGGNKVVRIMEARQ